jgi:hypothetical protein
MAMTCSPGANASITIYPWCRSRSLRFRRVLAWLTAGLPSRGRERGLGNPVPARSPEPPGELSVSGSEPGMNMLVVYARNDEARRMVAGFAAATRTLSPIWQQLDRALADVPALGSVIARLTAELAGPRLDRANLIAAMQAALAAHREGESDPLSYLRDELAERQMSVETPRGDRDDV